MPIPEVEKQIVEVTLAQYCNNKIPELLRNKVKINYKIRGNSITLFEMKPAFLNPEEWIDIPVAQFRYNQKEKNWLLYCADRNSRWHPYLEEITGSRFDDLLQEVENDSTGIFRG